MNEISGSHERFGKLIEAATETMASGSSELNDKLISVYQNETKCDPEYAKETVGKVSETIDSIVENLQELQGLKEQGFTREDWLKKKIDESTEHLTEDNKTDVINATRCSLITANKEMGIPVPETGVKVLSPFEGLNAKVIVNDLTSEIRDNTLLGAISFESGNITIDKKHKEIKAVKDYFESKLDSPNDPLFVKAVSTATVIAKDKGLLPKAFENKSPEELAMIVDRGVTDAKVFSKIGVVSQRLV